jgi:hypothetical protein
MRSRKSHDKKSKKNHCTVCGRLIQGRHHFWSKRVQCLNCKRYFSRNVTLTKNCYKKWARTAHEAKPIRRSLFRRIFG